MWISRIQYLPTKSNRNPGPAMVGDTLLTHAMRARQYGGSLSGRETQTGDRRNYVQLGCLEKQSPQD